jgi:hypothetical protein
VFGLPLPALKVRRSWYERIGGFDTSYRNAADYDCILRLFSQPGFKAVYPVGVLVKVRLGGAGNRSLANMHGIQTKKNRSQGCGFFIHGAAGSACSADVGSLRAFLALLDFKFNFLVLSQAAEAAGALNFAEVGEEVFATTIRGDEAKALAVVEPFNGASLRGHGIFPFTVAAPAHAGAVQKRAKKITDLGIHRGPTEARHRKNCQRTVLLKSTRLM